MRLLTAALLAFALLLPAPALANDACNYDWTMATIAEAQGEEYLKQQLYEDAADAFETAAGHYDDASHSCFGNNSIIAYDRAEEAMNKHFTAKWLNKDID